VGESHGFGPGSKVPSYYPYREFLFEQALAAQGNGHLFFAFSRTLSDISAELTLDGRLLLLASRILDGGEYELGKEGERHFVRVILAGGARQMSYISVEEARALGQLLDPEPV
jgi:hypothetical protein